MTIAGIGFHQEGRIDPHDSLWPAGLAEHGGLGREVIVSPAESLRTRPGSPPGWCGRLGASDGQGQPGDHPGQQGDAVQVGRRRRERTGGRAEQYELGWSNDPVWSIDPGDLPDGLSYRRDSPTAGHGVIEPSRTMTYDEYQQLIESTAGSWSRVDP
jgi:hypothetical protein